MLMHELKNPLSGIVGASELLFKSMKNKENKELADLIQVEAKRINKLLLNSKLLCNNNVLYFGCSFGY